MEHYPSWIGSPRAQTSKLLQQCGIIFDGQWRKRQKHPNNPSGSQDVFPKTTCIVITNFPAVGSITSYIILSFDQFRLLKSGLKFKSSEVCQSQLHWKPLVSCQLPPITHNSLYIQFIYVLQASVFLNGTEIFAWLPLFSLHSYFNRK